MGDFQQMNNSKLPQFQQSYTTPAQQRADTGGWHQDFAQQFRVAPKQHGMSQPGHIHGQSNYQYTPALSNTRMGMQNQFTGGMLGAQIDQPMIQEQPAEAFDEAAFAKAFEEAARSEMKIGQDTTQNIKQHGEEQVDIGQDVIVDDLPPQPMAPEQLSSQERIGADLIHDPMKVNQEYARQEDPDALAKTAGQLLHSVRNNHSEKFQKSQFLELMRQLRDKTVMVKGDNIVGTSDELLDDLEMRTELADLNLNGESSHSSQQTAQVDAS
jgi:hypothetical protein